MNWCRYLVGVDSVDPKMPVAPPLDAVRQGKATIRKGQSGESVRYVQAIVGVVVTGNFDDKTVEAVKAFQRRSKIAVDGVVGKSTIAALDKIAGSSGAGVSVVDFTDEQGDDPKASGAPLSAPVPSPSARQVSSPRAVDAPSNENRPWWHYVLGGVAALGAGVAVYKVAP